MAAAGFTDALIFVLSLVAKSLRVLRDAFPQRWRQVSQNKLNWSGRIKPVNEYEVMPCMQI
jgi:hypothetical protein